MRITRLSPGLILALSCICLQAQPPQQKITVTGKLGRIMAIGAESNGWAVQLDSATNIDGKQVTSIQINYSKTDKLEKLENKHVKATGSLSRPHVVETGEQPVVDVSSIREANAISRPAPAPTTTFNLSGSEWLLENLAGSEVLHNVHATLAFPEARKVAGNGSCNRFFGPAEISGDTIKLGPLASSRMACPEAVMNQETKYNYAADPRCSEGSTDEIAPACFGLAGIVTITEVPGFSDRI